LVLAIENVEKKHEKCCEIFFLSDHLLPNSCRQSGNSIWLATWAHSINWKFSGCAQSLKNSKTELEYS
jgi:hypothetical protein